MRASGTFTVVSFEPVDWTPEITTGLATGHAHITKLPKLSVGDLSS